MKVKVGISVRHAHLTKETYQKLFGNTDIKKLRDLDQIGQYASESLITIKLGERKIENVRIIGPLREYNQVEISRTDAYYLKVNPPIKSSGDLKESLPITIIGPKGEITLEKGLIIANRHIHLTKEDEKKYNLENEETVCIKIEGEKAGILKNVKLKVAENSSLALHLDTDDGNAFGLKTGDIVEVLKEKK